MPKLLIINLIISLIYISLVYAVARTRQRFDTVDIGWGIGFIVLAWATYMQTMNGRSLLLAILVSIWGVRLAYHIGSRAIKSDKDDRRYVELAEKWETDDVWTRAYYSIFLVQGTMTWLISLPVSLAANHALHGLGWLSIVGATVWLFGFIVETTADRQLGNFLKRPNHPKIMQEGLWRYSRHPNYFGELTEWWAIAITCLQVTFGWLGLIGPLVLTLSIVFISGIPPIEKRRAKDPAFREYMRRTSVLIPLPPRGN